MNAPQTPPRRPVPAERQDGRYGRILREAGGELGPALAHAAREAQAVVPAAGAHAAPIRDVSAGVVAPTLIGFVLWTLLDAEERGLRRLYFLARDGQVLLRVAEILARRLGLGVECRYLYASRQAWIHAIADPRGPEQAVWFEEDLWKRFRPGVTRIERILSRIGFEPEDLDALASFPALAPHLASPSETTRLRAEDIPALAKLFRSENFLDAVTEARARNRTLVLDYLAQEGLLDGEPIGIVDSGWAGQIHKALCELLAGQGVPPAECFYFGFKERSIPEWAEHRHWYQYSPMEGRRDTRFRPDGLEEKYVIAYLEVFCAAEHGTLVRYARENDRVIPVFPAGWVHATGPWGIATMRETIARVCEAVSLDRANAEAALDLRPAIKALFEAFWLEPTPDEAAAWGAFPLDLGEGEGVQTVALAAPYTLREVLATLRSGRDTQRRHSYHWIPAGLVLTPPPLRAAMRAYFGLRRLRGRVG